MTIYYGRKDYTYNGGDKFFTITFPYIKKEHIEVFINEVKTTNYTYLTDNQISVSDALIANDIVSIRRITPINDRMVKFTNTSILSKDNQNLAQEQMFYAVQENTDKNAEFVEIAEAITNDLIVIDTKVVESNTAASTATAQAVIAVAKAQEAVDAAASMSDATEVVKGRARYATSVEALAGTNDDSTMTPLKVKSLIDYCNRVLENTKAARKDFLIAGSTHSTVKICAGTLIKCTLSSKEYKLKQTEEFEFDAVAKLDTGTVLTAGKDYSIYLVENVAITSGLDFKVSLNGTYPVGFSATTAYKIGGFHTECVSVTSANAPALTPNTYWTTHPAIGYNAGDIIPISIWTLLHRPISEPNGMVYINLLNLWADIYLQSGVNSLTKSLFGGTITDTRSQIQHQADLAQVGKRPMTDYEFMVAAEGSNQRTNIFGSVDPVTTGGHLDTAGERMTSGFFLEDCCGALWQHLITALGGASAGAFAEYPDTARGQYYWNTYYFLAGGSWPAGACCGSWSRDSSYVRSNVFAYIGCRGVSLPLFN
jgi:hypothetical protein